ncbi:membrane protein insertase YidC [Endozoicomonadaceae bacterium StTr2]
MDLQRTLLIGALVLVGVLTLQQWQEDYHQREPVPVSQTLRQADPGIEVGNATDAPSVQSSTGIIDDSSAAVREQLVNITTDALQLQIDTRGGDIVFAALPKYPQVKGSPEPFVILQDNAQRNFIAQSGLAGANGPDSRGRPVYAVDKTSFELAEGQKQLVVDLKLKDNGVDIIKRYTLQRGSYEVRVDYLINNTTDKTWQANFYAQLKRDNSEDPSKQQGSSMGGVSTYLGAAVRSSEKPYLKLPFDEFSKSQFKDTVEGGYAAVLQHYFVTAWVPTQNEQHTYTTRNASDGNHIVGFYDSAVRVQPDQSVETGAVLYVGPKAQKDLGQLAEGLELTVDYGWLWFISQPLFWLLQTIHALIGNWGWSIILLTVLVKGAFFPLSAASYRSMAKMRKLTPKIQNLKEQYGDDRQKMSQAMMELYKKEKVNPMGGCLPILVQMPVFIALYWVLLESVELRQAPWMGWITDLSQMDPYFILPLIMGASMFVQQLLNPTPPDPTQAKVMKLMPVIFTVFFLWFPAGLVLYWVVNNLLSILQQWIITRQIEADPNA